MKRPTPITAIAVITAKQIANPIRSRLASDGLSRRDDREYACAAMGDEATGQTDGSAEVPEGIDRTALEAWFSAEAAACEPPLVFERIAGGQSNLTYRVSDAGERRWALRRPPLGRTLGSAHDMGREYRVVSALTPTPVPVAPLVGFCEDESVLGVPFYAMEFVTGPVLRSIADAEQSFPEEEERARIGLRVADTLAAIHAVDPDAIGLGELGRKEDYVARQLRRWHGQWEKSKTRELATIDQVHDALAARVPEQGPATIVHGDYRLDNMILAPSGEVAAVVDWELSTLGDPLADLGTLMAYWPERDAGDPLALGTPANMAPGFPTRAELAARYAEVSGRDVSDLNFYLSLGYWKLAIILEGVYARKIGGGYGEVDEGVHYFKTIVEQLAEAAAAAERG
jgi:aminoglycoside phosphotransferase (APT) family kinase protein